MNYIKKTGAIIMLSLISIFNVLSNAIKSPLIWFIFLCLGVLGIQHYQINENKKEIKQLIEANSKLIKDNQTLNLYLKVKVEEQAETLETIRLVTADNNKLIQNNKEIIKYAENLKKLLQKELLNNQCSFIKLSVPLINGLQFNKKPSK